MRCLFKDNIPLAELVLRIIIGKKELVITDCETQKDMKRLVGARSICLDAYGTDSAVREMCKVMEDMRNETALAERRRIAHAFVLMGELSYEKIAEGTELSIEEIEKLAVKEEKRGL